MIEEISKNTSAKMQKYKYIYIASFFILNLVDVLLITLLNKGFNWETSFFMIINSFVGNLGIILFAFSLSILNSRTDIGIARNLLIATGFFSFFMFGVSLYYGYYKMFPSFYNLDTFGGEGGLESLDFLLSSVLKLLVVSNPLFLLPFVFVLVGYLLIFRGHKENIEYQNHYSIKKGKKGFLVIVLTLSSVLCVLASLKAKDIYVKSTWHEDNKTVLYGIQSCGAYGFYVDELCEYVFGKPEEKATNDEEFLKELEQSQESTSINLVTNEEIKNSKYTGVFEGKNLLLIQMESMSNFLIGLQANINGEYKEITPVLNNLVGKSVYFSNYYTTVGIGNTSDAEFSAMTGLTGLGNLYTVYNFMGENYEALPKQFSKKGYSTFSTHANMGYYYLRNTVHIDSYGFDKHIGEEQLIEAGIEDENTIFVHDWIGDKQFLEYSVEEMARLNKETNKPVMDFSITVSCHIPYDLKDSEEGTFFSQTDLLFPEDWSNGLVEKDFINYLEHAYYADYSIGKALEKLEELGIKDDTVVVLYGDHGMGLEMFNMFYEAKELFKNDINEMIEYNVDPLQRELLEQQFLLQVPMFIYDASNSEVLPSQTIDLVRNHTCLKRTISNLFNLESDYYFGIDALSDNKTYSYNPRNLTFVIDDAVVSGSSGKYVVIDKDREIPKEQVASWRKEILKQKSFNDKILNYKVFIN